MSQLRSAVGSLSWLARQCWPDLAYAVSKLQVVVGRAPVADLVKANKTIRLADASHAAEEEYVPEDANHEPLCSLC